MQLMNKTISFARKGKPFYILSANYFENQESVIFVEAYEMDHVREAISGLNTCYQKISMLSIDEMTSIFKNLDSELQRPDVG